MIKIPTRKSAPVIQPEEKQSDKTGWVFDIETIGANEEKLVALMPSFEPDSRLKDPEKIKANLEVQKERYFARAALDWKTAQIVLIGVGDGKAYAPITGPEPEVIRSFFQICEQAMDNQVVFGGHAVKGFDLPMLVNRARVLGVSVPRKLLVFRYGKVSWYEEIFDTLDMFSFGRTQNYEGNGVDDICRALGVKGKSGSGADFPSLWKSDKKGAIEYNHQDILCEVEIAKACGIQF